MKIIIYILLLSTLLFSNETRMVYFYATDTNINNFKSLKISFDNYLHKMGDYEFQPFDKKETFEKNLTPQNMLVILSSWHYIQIANQYNLNAVLVASKDNNIKDTKILVGQKNMPINGVVTSAYDKDYTSKLLHQFNTDLSVLIVPKELDALMSVGFGMSNFALVSKDSFNLLKEVNPTLANNLTIYNESKPTYRMMLAYHGEISKNKKLIDIFENMGLKDDGKEVLNQIGIDKFILFPSQDLEQIRRAR